MKTALVYDRLNKWGGAERVLLALHKMFPDAPLYTSLRSVEKTKWASDFEIKTSFLDRISILQDYNDLVPMLMPIAFESFSFDEYDLVISVTSEAAKGIITKPTTKHISYCLTPTRYLWSGYEEYFKNPVLKTISLPVVSYLRAWDRVAAQRPDKLIAISSEVKKRIKKYYGLDSEIIFPPIMLEKPKMVSKKGEFFLIVSRMSRFNNYKRLDIAIDAFNSSGESLKIVGSGPLLSKYKNMAKGNIEFVGEVDDIALASYYQNSEALIFPGLEDFGLVMAEAQFFGKPVIAFNGGGAKDIIKEGVTGELFNEQSPSSLLRAMEKFKESSYNKAEIEESSKRFSFEKFKEELNAVIKNL